MYPAPTHVASVHTLRCFGLGLGGGFSLSRSVPLCASLSFFSLLRFTVRRAFPPQHPSLCRKKERKLFLPPSPSLSLSHLQSRPPIGPLWGVSRGTHFQAYSSSALRTNPLRKRDRLEEMFIICLAWNPGSVWSLLLLQQNTSGAEGGSLPNAFLLQRALMDFTAPTLSAEKQTKTEPGETQALSLFTYRFALIVPSLSPFLPPPWIWVLKPWLVEKNGGE